jgi:hypothetical protein
MANDADKGIERNLSLIVDNEDMFRTVKELKEGKRTSV